MIHTLKEKDLGLRRLETLTPSPSEPTTFDTEAGPLAVTFYAPGIVRVRLGDAPRPDYGLLVGPPTAITPTRYEQGDAFRLEAGDLALELDVAPARLRLFRAGRPALASTEDGHISGGWRVSPLAHAEGLWSLALGLRSHEPVYGLGEKFGPLNRRGQLITSWNEDALGVNSEFSYKNLPFAWSPAGWGLYVHTTSRVLHGVGYPQWSQRSYVVRVQDPVLDLFFLAGDTPAALLERFTYLTGRAPLPPRWGFGVWMSRCYYRTAEEALDVARELRARRVPCDVFTLDGRAWLKVETRFGFEWDADRYPDPASFARELKALGFRLCVWEYPYISVQNPLFGMLAEKGYLLRTAEGDPYIYHWDIEPFGDLLTPLPSSGVLDFTNPDAYAWFRDMHAGLFDIGVDVIKTDFGEQVPEDAVASNGESGAHLHNVYPMLYNRCVYEATAKFKAGPAMVWGRSGWTGSQRYPIQWGGDSQGDWEGLAASIRGALSWGMSGVPFYTHDIGGFYGAMPSPEHYVRSMQVGVMTSHTRFHGTTPREPWAFGEEAEAITREWLAWRYRLLPYLEACAVEARETGLPVMRAMPLAFPDDRVARAFEEQYMLGPALFVAPVLADGGEIEFYLPRGIWHDIWTGERVAGGRTLTRTIPLDKMPIYGREGHLLPLGPAVEHVGELEPGVQLEEIWVFGPPRFGLTFETTRIDVDEAGHLVNLPGDVTVHYWRGDM